MVKKIEEFSTIENSSDENFAPSLAPMDIDDDPIVLKNVNYNIHQDNDILIVFAYVRQIQRDTLQIQFYQNCFVVKFKTGDTKFLSHHNTPNKDRLFCWLVNTRHKINPSQCFFKITPSSIELTLSKAVPGRWESLEAPQLPLKANEVSLNLEDQKPKDYLVENQKQPMQPATPPKVLQQRQESPQPMVKATAGPLVPAKCTQTSKPGLVGLENLGNTCFMNSVLQCLSAVPDFRHFFLSGKYRGEINRTNPLGSGGKLAAAFADLLKVLWSPSSESISTFCPSKIKTLIGLKASQFTGFAQHDAQELMTFLLDGLHEDLNRVKNKPYGETVESEGKSDERIAEESWKIHKNRNNSIVTDLFHGQYKSKLICPVCAKVSITFDPFLNLSVPLPKKIKTLPVFFFSKNPDKRPIKVFVRISQDATAEELKEAVASKTNTRPKNLRAFEVFKHKIHKMFDKGSSLSSVSSNDVIFVCEVLDEETAGEPIVEMSVVQRVVMPKPVLSCSFCNKDTSLGPSKLRRCTKCYRVGYCDVVCQRNHWGNHKKSCRLVPELVGQPFYFSLPQSQATLSNVANYIEAYSRYSVDVFQPPIEKKQTPPPPPISQEMDCKSEASFSNSIEMEATSQKEKQELGEGSSKTSDPSKDASTDSSGDSGSAEAHFHVRVLSSSISSTVPEIGTLLKPNMLLCSPIGDHEVPQFYQLALDWKNNDRSKHYVLVQTKKLEYDPLEGDEAPYIDQNNEATLDQCLQLFTEPEVLSPNEAWYCPSCKEHREATKRLSLWRLPRFLIIQLKRFSFKNYLWRDKIDKMVSFPIKGLDMAKYYCGSASSRPLIYDLIAVVNHHGGILGGHYTALTTPHHAEWYLFDDATVKPWSEKRIVNKDAYLLFYQWRFSRPSSLDSNVIQTLHPEEEEDTASGTEEMDH